MTSEVNLATTLRNLGEVEEAEAIYKKIIELQANEPNVNKAALAINLANYSKLLMDSDRLEDAEPVARRGARLLSEEYGNASYPAANGRAKLADVLSRMGRHSEAEAEFLTSYDIYIQRLGAEHRRSRELAQRIADAYQRWDEDEPGAGHGQTAANWWAIAEGANE